MKIDRDLSGGVLLSSLVLFSSPGCNETGNFLARPAVSSHFKQNPTQILVPMCQTEPDKKAELERLEKERNRLNQDYLFRVSNGEAKQADQDLQEYVFCTADFLSQTFDHNSVFVTSGTNVFIRGREYKLDDHNDLTFADALLQSLIMVSEGTSYSPQQRLRGLVLRQRPIPEEIEALYGKIRFRVAESMPFVNANGLAEFQRITQVLEQAGKSVPKRVVVSPNGSDYDLNTQTLLFNGRNPHANILPITTLAYYYLNTDQRLVDVFGRRVKNAYSDVGDSIQDPTLTFADDLRQDYKGGDDFIRAFVRFMTDGVGFRHRISYAKSQGFLAEARVLWDQYRTFQDWLGFDTSVTGKQRQLVNYQVGDMARIDDYEPELPGIYLRQGANTRIDLSIGSVEDQDLVRIIDGPTLFVDEQAREASRWWKIEAGNIVEANGLQVWIPDYRRVGFVSEEWFGGLVR